MAVLYTDVDGTLAGPGGDLFHGGSTRIADALLRARAAGLAVVPVSGRGRVQLFELSRLLGLPRAIAELGCIHLEGHKATHELGAFPFAGETPVDAMHARGAIAAVTAWGLVPAAHWNAGREATFLLQGTADVSACNAELERQGLGWCELIENGRVTHLAPAGTGKAFGVRIDRERRSIAREDAFYVGDAASDLACADLVRECWLVANADPALDWPARTSAAYADGVAEVIDRVLAQ